MTPLQTRRGTDLLLALIRRTELQHRVAYGWGAECLPQSGSRYWRAKLNLPGAIGVTKTPSTGRSVNRAAFFMPPPAAIGSPAMREARYSVADRCRYYYRADWIASDRALDYLDEIATLAISALGHGARLPTRFSCCVLSSFGSVARYTANFIRGTANGLHYGGRTVHRVFRIAHLVTFVSQGALSEPPTI